MIQALADDICNMCVLILHHIYSIIYDFDQQKSHWEKTKTHVHFPAVLRDMHTVLSLIHTEHNASKALQLPPN